MAKVTIIQPTKTLQDKPLDDKTIPKVAAYARVSTEQEAQQQSLKSQVEYYTKKIKNSPDWEFVGAYADDGRSGTSTKRRDEFNQMIEDAEDGKIDLILTKSISRFARNTLDTVKYTRHLADIGVEVFFEKEGISNKDRNAEMLLLIGASMAEGESRNLAANVKWGKQRKMQEGKVTLGYGRFLGYKKGADGKPEIVPEEAETVRKIYQWFLEGKNYATIARMLTEEGVLTPGHKKCWRTSTVRSILTNEKYKGDALLGKTFVVDCLSHKVVKNTGQQAQYYISDSHEAIIDPATFQLVQQEVERRGTRKGSKTDYFPFTGKVICAHCKESYGHKVWNSRGRIKYDMWVCNCKSNHMRDEWLTCKSANIRQEKLEDLSVAAMNRVWARKAEIRAKYEEKYDLEAIRKKYEAKIANSRVEQADTSDNLAEFTKHGLASCNRNFQLYEERRAELIAEADAAKERLAKTEREYRAVMAEAERTRRFVDTLDQITEPITKFDNNQFMKLIDKAMVQPKAIVYTFMDGSKEKLEIEN